MSKTESIKNSLRQGPDEKGYYGEFGSRYAPEILMSNLIELEKCFSNELFYNEKTKGYFDPGALTRTRTANLLITNQLLYQLSYEGLRS